MIRVVAVDIDDTLCLTEAVCFELENDALARMNRPPMARHVHLATWGQALLEAMPSRSPGIDLDHFGDVYPGVLREYIADGRLDVVPHENLVALDHLKALGCSVVLLTSRTESEVAHFLDEDHDLAGRIATIYHGGNLRFPKPDPRAFDELLTDHRARPTECVYVGDSPSDASAATGAGLAFIACLQSGIRHRGEFADYAVAAFVDRFSDVVEAVETLGQIFR